MMKNIVERTLAALGLAAMAGSAACTDQKPEKSWLETYAEKFPKDYAEYYWRFFHAYSCRPADKEAEGLYDRIVQSAVRTDTLPGSLGGPEDIARSGWWDMAYVEVARTSSKGNGRSAGESKSISGDGKNNSVGYTGNYAGNDEISLKSLRLERVYPSDFYNNEIVRLVQNFNGEDISRLGIKTVADLNNFLQFTCRLVSGYDLA